MGLGDWLLASAQVREANMATGKKVMLGDGKEMYFEPEIFANNPRMAELGEDCVWVPNYPGSRPYIRALVDKHIIFNDDWRPTPGEVFFSDAEFEWREQHAPKEPYIVIEPLVKNRFSHGVNKSWPSPYWEELSTAKLPLIQLGTSERKYFPQVRTETFRQAMLILSKAKLFVGTDGGLHHASAALGVPAVVIWTGFSSPKHLGYDDHINLHDGDKPCGNYRGPCDHCAKKARAILPEQVLEAIHEKCAGRLVA